LLDRISASSATAGALDRKPGLRRAIISTVIGNGFEWYNSAVRMAQLEHALSKVPPLISALRNHWKPMRALCGAAPSAFSDMFPASTRVSGFGVAYGIGTAIFSGTTPFVLTALIEKTANHLAPAFYLIGPA